MGSPRYMTCTRWYSCLCLIFACVLRRFRLICAFRVFCAFFSSFVEFAVTLCEAWPLLSLLVNVGLNRQLRTHPTSLLNVSFAIFLMIWKQSSPESMAAALA